MATVDHHEQQDSSGAPPGLNRFKGGTNRSPCENHIVHQQNIPSFDADGKVGGLQGRIATRSRSSR